MNLRDAPPAASALTLLLAFAAGVVCGLAAARAVWPARVVRFYSVPLPADAELLGTGGPGTAAETLQ